MPGQQKQYSRSPIAHCSTVPAARARLSAARQPPSRRAWPRPSPAPSPQPPWRAVELSSDSGGASREMKGRRGKRKRDPSLRSPTCSRAGLGSRCSLGTHARLAEPHLPTSSQGGIAAPHVLNRLKHFKT